MAHVIFLQYFHCFSIQKHERNLNYVKPSKKNAKEACEKPKPFADALVEDISSLCRVVSKLDSEKASLKLKLDELKFGLQRFAGSDEDIRFYTGFPNYSTLITFYEFLLPAANLLNYWGSDNADNRLLE